MLSLIEFDRNLKKAYIQASLIRIRINECTISYRHVHLNTSYIEADLLTLSAGFEVKHVPVLCPKAKLQGEIEALAGIKSLSLWNHTKIFEGYFGKILKHYKGLNLSNVVLI